MPGGRYAAPVPLALASFGQASRRVRADRASHRGPERTEWIAGRFGKNRYMVCCTPHVHLTHIARVRPCCCCTRVLATRRRLRLQCWQHNHMQTSHFRMKVRLGAQASAAWSSVCAERRIRGGEGKRGEDGAWARNSAGESVCLPAQHGQSRSHTTGGTKVLLGAGACMFHQWGRGKSEPVRRSAVPERTNGLPGNGQVHADQARILSTSRVRPNV